ncbi:uncharacterized acetyltransferase At3g50280-like [Phalaenopsis equestris]|uniref:uncharacterized acetyltransferase At3g50280-like n=1 Tax=Phalaenopsis equestris TaxID=78828 RepID=UPI0009E53972|nr:uncharacterized acetyltransferase At3g50280-like [Phalaenopsis equestris]
MPSSAPMVEIISKHTVKPPTNSSHPPLCHLTPWDVAMLCPHYIQKGLLFTNLPPSLPIHHLLTTLKASLSITLQHFYPLAGRLATQKHLNGDEITSLHVFIDCNDQGAEFIHAKAGKITSFDFLSPGDDIPPFVNSFFPLDGAVSHDGHSAPLLSVQITELAGGDIFIACCFNHVVGDGTSYWNFFNAWAEITRTNSLSLPPVHARWFIDGENPPVKLPFSDSSQFVERFSPPALRQRFFHFSAESIAKLKKKANEEIRTEENDRKQSQIVISSFQALCAMIWRAISRARRFPAEQLTTCRLAIQNRGRLRPPQSPEYFGNSIYAVEATAAAGELEANGLGWAARELNGAVNGHTDEAIRGKLREYHAAPMVYKMTMFDPKSVMVGSSPRFDMYGCDFGWGKGAAVRCGPANKFDGKVSAFPGREGDGSVDLEICLLPQFMADFLLDPEFLEAVSPPPQSLTKGLK